MKDERLAWRRCPRCERTNDQRVAACQFCNLPLVPEPTETTAVDLLETIRRLEERVHALERRAAGAAVGTFLVVPQDARVFATPDEIDVLAGIPLASVPGDPLEIIASATTHPMVDPPQPVYGPSPYELRTPIPPAVPPSPPPPPPAGGAPWFLPRSPNEPSPKDRPFDLLTFASGMGMALVGGIAILIGAAFFLSIAFSRGWVSPEVRVAIGLLVGVACLPIGGRFLGRRERVTGEVLLGVGLAVIDLSLLSATRLYDMIPVGMGLLGVLLAAAATARIAVQHDSRTVAGLAILFTLSAPPVLGASVDGVTVAFIAAVLVGSAAVVIARGWTWLASLAFVLTALQVSPWIHDEAGLAGGMLAVVGLWVIDLVVGVGEETRRPSVHLKPASATLMVLSSAFLMYSGFALLENHGSAPGVVGLFLALVAALHGLVGGYFVRRFGAGHAFGQLMLGTGVTALTLSFPAALGGEVVTVAWAAEGAALAWVYRRSRQPLCEVASYVLTGLAVAHLLAIEYPLYAVDEDRSASLPFLTGEALSLAVVLVGLGLTGWMIADRVVRRALLAVGTVLVVVAVPFETTGIPVLVLWSALALLLTWVDRVAPSAGVDPGADDNLRIQSFLDLAMLIPITAAAARYLSLDLPTGVVDWKRPDVPLRDLPTLATIVVVAMLGGVTWATHRRWLQVAASTAALLSVALLLTFEVAGVALVVGWCAVAAVGLVLDRGQPNLLGVRSVAGGFLWVVAASAWVGEIAPPTRLVVDRVTELDHPPLFSGVTLACLVLIAVLGLAARLTSDATVRRVALAVAAGICLYALSIAVVDVFQARVDGRTALASLQRQAQVALSILWGVIGGAAFASGIVRRRAVVQGLGLALLGVTTFKVFVLDMASLDASYRVLSFVGLGVLLLLSSYVYQRWQRDEVAESGAPA